MYTLLIFVWFFVYILLCGFSFSIFCVVCHVQCWYDWQQHWLAFYMLHSYLIITFIAHLWLYSCPSILRLLVFCRWLSKFCVEIILTIVNFMFVCLFISCWYLFDILFTFCCQYFVRRLLTRGAIPCFVIIIVILLTVVNILCREDYWQEQQLPIACCTLDRPAQPPPTHGSSWKNHNFQFLEIWLVEYLLLSMALVGKNMIFSF